MQKCVYPSLSLSVCEWSMQVILAAEAAPSQGQGFRRADLKNTSFSLLNYEAHKSQTLHPDRRLNMCLIDLMSLLCIVLWA